jgi:hypothetical protein
VSGRSPRRHSYVSDGCDHSCGITCCANMQRPLSCLCVKRPEIRIRLRGTRWLCETPAARIQLPRSCSCQEPARHDAMPAPSIREGPHWESVRQNMQHAGDQYFRCSANAYTSLLVASLPVCSKSAHGVNVHASIEEWSTQPVLKSEGKRVLMTWERRLQNEHDD